MGVMETLVLFELALELLILNREIVDDTSEILAAATTAIVAMLVRWVIPICKPLGSVVISMATIIEVARVLLQ